MAAKSIKATVRFDGKQSKWAIVDLKSGDVIEHFTHGIMRDVEFSSIELKETVPSYCGGGSMTNRYHIGVATGNLQKEVHGKDAIGFKNLAFIDGKFSKEDGTPMKKCKVLRLMANRAALYTNK